MQKKTKRGKEGKNYAQLLLVDFWTPSKFFVNFCAHFPMNVVWEIVYSLWFGGHKTRPGKISEKRNQQDAI